MLYLNIKYYLSRRLHNWFGAWRRRTKGWGRGGTRREPRRSRKAGKDSETLFFAQQKNSGHVRNPTGGASPAFLPSRAFRHRHRPMVDTMFGGGQKHTIRWYWTTMVMNELMMNGMVILVVVSWWWFLFLVGDDGDLGIRRRSHVCSQHASFFLSARCCWVVSFRYSPYHLVDYLEGAGWLDTHTKFLIKLMYRKRLTFIEFS